MDSYKLYCVGSYIGYCIIGNIFNNYNPVRPVVTSFTSFSLDNIIIVNMLSDISSFVHVDYLPVSSYLNCISFS